MVVKPMIRSNICINAHPVGCAKETERQIKYAVAQKAKRGIKTVKEGGKGPKTVLVLGCSTGYGLASRISAAFEYGADTIGVSFEKEPREHGREELIDLMRYHLDLYEKYELSPYDPLKHFYKIYINNFSGASEIRDRLMHTKSISEAREVLAEL